MNKPTGKCCDCRWYETFDRISGIEAGTCCYNPPVVLVIDDSLTTTWPKVYEEDFCSKWTTKR